MGCETRLTPDSLDPAHVSLDLSAALGGLATQRMVRWCQQAYSAASMPSISALLRAAA